MDALSGMFNGLGKPLLDALKQDVPHIVAFVNSIAEDKPYEPNTAKGAVNLLGDILNQVRALPWPASQPALTRRRGLPSTAAAPAAEPALLLRLGRRGPSAPGASLALAFALTVAAARRCPTRTPSSSPAPPTGRSC
jgi:hypothetical protein